MVTHAENETQSIQEREITKREGTRLIALVYLHLSVARGVYFGSDHLLSKFERFKLPALVQNIAFLLYKNNTNINLQ